MRVSNGFVISLMRTALGLLAGLVLLVAMPTYGAELPPDILKDKYLMVLERHLERGAYAKAFPYFDKLANLTRQYGIAIPPELPYRRALAHKELGQRALAGRYLTDYLAAVGKRGKHYGDALTLLVELETTSDKAPEITLNSPAPPPVRKAPPTRKMVAPPPATAPMPVLPRPLLSAPSQPVNVALAPAQESVNAAIKAPLQDTNAEHMPPMRAPVAAAPVPDAQEVAARQNEVSRMGAMARQLRRDALNERRARLARRFTAMVGDFRYDSEAQLPAGLSDDGGVFRLRARIEQRVTVGPGVCQLSYQGKGIFAVDHTPATGKLAGKKQRMEQGRVNNQVTRIDAGSLMQNETTQMHKAFNVYTFHAGEADQSIEIYGLGGYMLRLYDAAVAWAKSCA